MLDQCFGYISYSVWGYIVIGFVILVSNLVGPLILYQHKWYLLGFRNIFESQTVTEKSDNNTRCLEAGWLQRTERIKPVQVVLPLQGLQCIVLFGGTRPILRLHAIEGPAFIGISLISVISLYTHHKDMRFKGGRVGDSPGKPKANSWLCWRWFTHDSLSCLYFETYYL